MSSSTLATTPSIFKSDLTPSINTTQETLRRIEEFDWIFSMTFVVMIIALTGWVVVSLIHYGIKNKMWNKRQKNKHALNSGKIYACVVVLTCMCLLFHISSLVVFNIDLNGHESKTCFIISNVNLTFYLFVFTSVGLFLWFRQRAFFRNQYLNVNYNRIILIFSFASIFALLGCCSVLWVFLIGTNVYFASLANGCQMVLQQQQYPVLGSIFWIIVASCITLHYSILLGLLAYALLSIKSVSTSNVSNTTKSNDNNHLSAYSISMKIQNNIQKFKFLKIKSFFIIDKTCKNKNSLQQKIIALRRTILFALLSLVSFVVSEIFLHYYAAPNGFMKISLVILNVDAFLQLHFVIFSFTTYRRMLTSPIVKCST